MKKLLGYSLLATPFVLFFAHAVHKHGWIVAVGSFVTAVCVSATIYFGLRLIDG